VGFSLNYAFGKAGRHTRAIATQARAFISAQRRTLPDNPAIDFLYMQSRAIDATLFPVFYSEPDDVFYPLHRKYLPQLLEVNEAGFRRMSQAYASALLVGLPMQSGSHEEISNRAGALHTLAHLYDASQPATYWLEMARSPDDAGITAALLTDIAKVLRIAPLNKNEFASDWLSLLPSIDRATAIFQRSM
jgi:hypothetical protein